MSFLRITTAVLDPNLASPADVPSLPLFIAVHCLLIILFLRRPKEARASRSNPDILVQEYQDSRQRFLIGGTFEHVWDSAFDADSRLGTSAPTAAPTSGKGKGKGKGPKGPKSNKSILQRRKESKNDMAPVSAKSSRPEAREEASPPSSQTRNRKVAEFFSDVTFDLDDEEVVNFAIVGEGGGY